MSMTIKLSKSFLSTIPVTLTKRKNVKTTIYKSRLSDSSPGRGLYRQFSGWGIVERAITQSDDFITCYDLKTLLAIMYVLESKDFSEKQWETETGYIPVLVTSIEWRTFVEKILRRRIDGNSSKYTNESLLRLSTLVLTYELKSKDTYYYSKTFRPLWYFIHFVFKNNKPVEFRLGERSDFTRHKYYVEFVLDQNFFRESQEDGLTVHLEPVLYSTSAIGTMLALWIQGQKYTSLDEPRLLKYVLHRDETQLAMFRKRLAKAFDDLVAMGLIREWWVEKNSLNRHHYFWKKVRKFEFNEGWKLYDLGK